MEYKEKESFFQSIEEIEKKLEQLKELGIDTANLERTPFTIYSRKLSEVKSILETLPIDYKLFEKMKETPPQILTEEGESKGMKR